MTVGDLFAGASQELAVWPCRARFVLSLHQIMMQEVAIIRYTHGLTFAGED
jgi:hypothetical protein